MVRVKRNRCAVTGDPSGDERVSARGRCLVGTRYSLSPLRSGTAISKTNLLPDLNDRKRAQDIYGHTFKGGSSNAHLERRFRSTMGTFTGGTHIAVEDLPLYIAVVL